MYYGDIIQIRYVCRRKKGTEIFLIHERKRQRSRKKVHNTKKVASSLFPTWS